LKNIKTAIILAGGKGTRLAEQTKEIPKPLVEVGGTPILFHVMNHLAYWGITKIIIAGGYKVELVKEAVKNYLELDKDVSIKNGVVEEIHNESLLSKVEIIVANTGPITNTAQRIKICEKYLENNEDFVMTYGDTVSDVNLENVENQLYSNGKIMTLTAFRFQERFGILKIDDEGTVNAWAEKSMSKHEFINGGFICCRNEVMKNILPEDEDFSKVTMARIQQNNLMSAYVHDGFWHAMDSQRDYENLNKIYKENPELFHSK